MPSEDAASKQQNPGETFDPYSTPQRFIGQMTRRFELPSTCRINRSFQKSPIEPLAVDSHHSSSYLRKYNETGIGCDDGRRRPLPPIVYPPGLEEQLEGDKKSRKNTRLVAPLQLFGR